MNVLAKKPSRGPWRGSAFYLDAPGLAAIDALPKEAVAVVVKSFRKAAVAKYGREWPEELKDALRQTTWGRDMGGGGPG